MKKTFILAFGLLFIVVVLYSNNIIASISGYLGKNSDIILPEIVLKNDGQKLALSKYA